MHHRSVRRNAILRSEASSFLAKTSLHEAAKILLTLGNMLDEYIILKEQKVILDQKTFNLDKRSVESRAFTRNARSHDCLQFFVRLPYSAAITVSSVFNATVMAGKSIVSSPTGYLAYGNPMITSSMPNNKRVASTSFSTSKTIIGPPRKRRCFKVVSDANQAAKKPCPLHNNQLPDKGTNAVSQSENEVNRKDSAQQCSVPEPSFVLGNHG